MSYDFSALNDKDFEELVRDILSAKIKIDFQSFKSGKDKGIDLRYASNNNENEIIVQVKHFLESGLIKLKSVLKTQEREKVISLNPQRYIFVTSIPLNPQNKDEIKTIFTPFIHSTVDVLGKQDLNNFLRNNPSILEKHFKLWLSDTTVLKRILHNGIKGRSEFTEENIKSKIRIFVPSKTYKLAVDILNGNNFILITGNPGVGKTTMANFLTYQFLAEGFELVYVREIWEAEDLCVLDKKQIFYFDDFLGSISLDLKSSRNVDSAIVNFIERIKSNKQKRLILTCRTTLLNKAKQESEKIENSKLESSNYEVIIDNYRNIDKARILYNHIYFSNLSDELKSVFFFNKFYWKIIKHKHYNPRVVEFFTDIDRLQPGIDYSKEVLDFLNDPSKIWEKSYTNQISNDARLFLSTLYSLGGKYVIDEPRLKEAFDVRLSFEVANNNYTKITGTFNKVVKELLGGFINRTIKTEKNYNSIEYRFLNPSIEDFLYSYFTKNLDEYFAILSSALFIDQYKGRISTIFDKNSKVIYFGEHNNYKKLLKVFIDRIPYLKGTGRDKDLDTVIVFIRLFKWNDISEYVIRIINNILISSLSWNERDNLIEILNYIADNDIVNEFDFSVKDVLLLLSDNMTYYYQIEKFSNLISKQKIYRDIINNSKIHDIEYNSAFQNNIDQSWSIGFEYYINETYNLNTLTNRDELKSIIEKRKQEAKKMNEMLSVNPSPVIDDFLFNYEDQLSRNIVIQSESEIKIKSIQNSEDETNELLEINKLFNSENDYDWDSLPF